MSLMVLGIGNELGGDDGVGNHMVRFLNQQVDTHGYEPPIHAIDTGTMPENYTSLIRRDCPDLLVLVDAAEMGLSPGHVRLIHPERLKTVSFSTHGMPLTAFIDYVKTLCGRVVLIGIQPSEKVRGQELTTMVRQAAEQVTELLLEGRIDEIEPLE